MPDNPGVLSKHTCVHTKTMGKIHVVSSHLPVATVFHGCFKRTKQKKKKKIHLKEK